ncbi:MAG TPA: condensation domain-containing protein, partial [Candidatus Kapabacteria bacterium]|nr:condensation domain-containing protein [Candidatus Kapabacteria bacterium]
ALIKEQESYWLDMFAEEVPVLHLPTDYPRPGVQSFAGSIVEFILSETESGSLKRLAKETGLTLYMSILSVFTILLSRLSGQEDIVVGTPVAARRHTDLEKIIGMFVNMLALRNNVPVEASYREFVKELKYRTLKAYENQEYQFEILVEKINVARDIARNPVFDVVFNLLNMEEAAGNSLLMEPGSSDHYTHREGTAKFDLILMAVERGERIHLSFEYCTRLFKPGTIERYISYFKNIIGKLSGNIDQHVVEIDILSQDEREQILHEFNNTAAGYPKDKTIDRIFVEQAEKFPDRIALVGADLRVCPNCLTYGELNEKSDELAVSLIEKGALPGTIVGIMMERSVEMIIGILGILKAGGAYMPIDPDYPHTRIYSMLSDSGSAMLLCQSEILKKHSFTMLQGLQGTCFNPYVTEPCEPVADMNALPFPDRSLVNYEKYTNYIGQAMVKHSIALQGTRGCPYNCAYCHKIWSKKQIARSSENLYEEVKLYYDMGVRRFVFIDDIFNLDIKNSSEFFQKIIRNRLNLNLFFPNGLRGDILTRDYIDLMVEAGTINVALALETASPRLQKLIKKNLNLDKLQESLDYFQQKYPQVILELFTMHGFPTETEVEAFMTLDFIKRQKWLHFPYAHILKIYPNTHMAELAMACGISKEAIAASANLAYHELPSTLPFEKSFTLNYQADFLNNYFLCKERLLHVLPYQAKALTQAELVEKYDSYLPADIDNFDELLKFSGLEKDQLNIEHFHDEAQASVPDLDKKIRNHFPIHKSNPDALRILFLDLSQYFNDEKQMLYDVVEPPLGLMYLLTYLYRQYGEKINGKIAKSRIDFNNYQELQVLLEDFKPDIIGIRSLTIFKDFFHHTISLIRQWRINVPIIAGGPYASSDYKTLLQDKHINLAVLGEGEIIMSRLVKKILENGKMLPEEERLKEIPGIAFMPRSSVYGVRDVILIDRPVYYPMPILINPANLISPRDVAYIIFTSGSTGKPKGVLIEHKNVVRLLFNERFQFDFNEHDVWSLFHSYNFDFSVWEMYGALLYGGRLVIIPKMTARDPQQFWNVL